MVPGHPSHSALGAFHPTPIASSRTSAQPPAAAPAPTTTGCAGSRTPCRKHTAPPPSRCSKDVTAHPEDDEVDPRAQHTTAGVRGNYVNPHTDDDEPRPRDDHAAPCPAATTPRLPPPRPRRRAVREAELPVGSTRPLHRRAAAKMSPRIRTGPEAVLTAHAPTPSAAAATARRKPDQVPIPEQSVSCP